MENYKNYTNAEINLRMKTLENEYEAKKAKIMALIKDLHSLDIEYDKAKKELDKRKQGLWQY